MPTQNTPVKSNRGEMIVLCSAKGGCGRTGLAVNLAIALSKNNIQICVIDGDFQFGDVHLALDLHPPFSIKDVVDGIESMDKFTLVSFLTHHPSGVKLLAAPDHPEYAELITPRVVDRVCDLLLASHDYLIADTSVGLQESTLTFIEKADRVLLLTTMEMSSLKHTKQMLATLDLLGLRNKVHIVLNRFTMESVIKAADVPDLLGVKNLIYIPNDWQVVSSSLNNGIPCVINQGTTEIAKSVFKMAEQLISHREMALFKPKPPSMLDKLIHHARKLNSFK